MNGHDHSKQPPPAPPADAEDLQEAKSMGELFAVVQSWHTQLVNYAQHMLQVPEGAAFEIEDKAIELTGPALEGFKLATELMIMQIKAFPLVAISDDAQEESTEQKPPDAITH